MAKSIEEMIAGMMQEQHLGDGLFASFDGYQIQLRAPRPHGDDLVFLEPGTLLEFERYLTKLKETANNVRQIQALVEQANQPKLKVNVEVASPLDGQEPLDPGREREG